jgi:hypothetical protein
MQKLNTCLSRCHIWMYLCVWFFCLGPCGPGSNVNDIETKTQSIRFYIRFYIELEQILLLQVEIGMKRNVSICSRMKLEQKGTFLFTPSKRGTKRNKSFCLNLFWYRIGTYTFAQGRKWNKKDSFFLLQEKIGMERLLILTPGKSA